MSLRVRLTDRGSVLDEIENRGKGKFDANQYGPINRLGEMAPLPVLPQDAVGVGARWRIERPVSHYTSTGVPVAFTYELLGIDGNVLTIGVEYKLSVRDLEVRYETSNDEATVHSLDSRGTGRASISLVEPIALASEFDKAYDSDYEIRSAGIQFRTLIKGELSIRIDTP